MCTARRCSRNDRGEVQSAQTGYADGSRCGSLGYGCIGRTEQSASQSVRRQSRQVDRHIDSPHDCKIVLESLYACMQCPQHEECSNGHESQLQNRHRICGTFRKRKNRAASLWCASIMLVSANARCYGCLEPFPSISRSFSIHCAQQKRTEASEIRRGKSNAPTRIAGIKTYGHGHSPLLNQLLHRWSFTIAWEASSSLCSTTPSALTRAAASPSVASGHPESVFVILLRRSFQTSYRPLFLFLAASDDR